MSLCSSNKTSDERWGQKMKKIPLFDGANMCAYA